jgi:hypothetical protein
MESEASAETEGARVTPTLDVVELPAMHAVVPEIIDVAPAPPRMLALVPRGDARAVALMLVRAGEALAEARTLQQVQHVQAAASAALAYIRQRKLSDEVRKQAWAIKLEAVRKLGGLLTEMAKAAGGRPYHAITGTLKVPVQTLKELDISKNESSRAQQLFQLPEEIFRKIRDENVSFFGVLATLRQERERQEMWEELNRERDQRIAATELHVTRCRELFALGIAPDLVITEPPMESLSELASACRAVPFVVLRVLQRRLPDVLQAVSGALTYHDITMPGASAEFKPNAKVLVLFCTDSAITRFKERRPSGTRRRPECETWQEEIVCAFSLEGDLVCDPFVTPKTALAAVGHHRRFVGASLDPAVVDKTRHAVEAPNQ